MREPRGIARPQGGIAFDARPMRWTDIDEADAARAMGDRCFSVFVGGCVLIVTGESNDAPGLVGSVIGLSRGGESVPERDEVVVVRGGEGTEIEVPDAGFRANERFTAGYTERPTRIALRVSEVGCL